MPFVKPTTQLPPRSGFVKPVVSSALTYPQKVAADGATFYYRLGEPSGTAAVDSRGALPNGVYQAGVVLAQPGALFGDPNTSMLTGPDSAWMQVPLNAIHTTGFLTWTIEAWLFPTAALVTATDDVAIITHDLTASFAPYVLAYGSAQSLFGTAQHVWAFVYNGAVDGKASEAAILPLNQWHHIVATLSPSGPGGTLTLYHNGASVGSGVMSFGIGDASSTLEIGRRWDSIHTFPGRIDEVAVYKNIVLTPAQILAHYNLGTTGHV